MTEHIDSGHLMTVREELWALGANADAIYLLNGHGDAWRTRPIAKNVDPFWPINRVLRQHGALGSTVLTHSTSWRPEGESVMLTFASIVACPDITNHWPAARPVTPLLLEIVGPPYTHAATEPPTPRYIDVLFHALRHLRYLRDESAEESSKFSDAWKRHLDAFRPALAGMYGQVHGYEGGRGWTADRGAA